MDGLYIQQANNVVFFSTARSMARFGLLILNNGNWNGNQIMTDANYFNEMVNTSQNINEAYGYLWWLNGKNNFMIPQLQLQFNGSLYPNAPNDLLAALGKNGQFINVVPSQNMVWIRMGDAPDNALVPFKFNEDVWEHINDLECVSTNTLENQKNKSKLSVYPNPAKDFIKLNVDNTYTMAEYKLYNNLGQIALEGKYNNEINISNLKSGFYYLNVSDGKITKSIKVIKE